MCERKEEDIVHRIINYDSFRQKSLHSFFSKKCKIISKIDMLREESDSSHKTLKFLIAQPSTKKFV